MDAPSALGPLLLLALLLQAAARLASAKQAPTQALTYQVGDTATFLLETPLRSNVSNLLWRSSSRGSMEAFAAWRSGEPIDTLSAHYSKRVAFFPEHWVLEIRNLTKADGGFYEVVEYQDSVEVMLKTFTLVVFKITTTPTEKFANGSCSVSLLCEAGAGARTQVEYSWSPPGKRGSTLHLTLHPADKDTVYTCTTSALGPPHSHKVTPYEACSSATRAAGRLLLGPALLTLLLLLL